MRTLLSLLAVVFFVIAFFVTKNRANSPDADVVVGLITASPFLVVGLLLAVSALLMDRER